MQVKEDILTYLSKHEENAQIPWDCLTLIVEQCKSLFNISNDVTFRDMNGEAIPFDTALVYIFLKKIIAKDIKLSSTSINPSTAYLYLLVLLKIFDLISCMDNPPIKTTFKLLLMFINLYTNVIMVNPPGKQNSCYRLASERFVEIKEYLHSGMSDKEIKYKIVELTGFKDNKTLKKYLNLWREFEKQQPNPCKKKEE